MKMDIFKMPENNWIKLIFWSVFILFFSLSFFSLDTAGGADSYIHYFFSRQAWKSPYLLLDHWGKPIFTLLSMPFAQFGFNGIKLFNILLGLLSAYAALKIASHYNFSFKIPLIFLILFAPIYMLILFSGLTEILFGAFLITGVWLIVEKKYVLSSLLISFIIFSRTEGLAFILLWAFILVLNKKYKAIPYLFSGFIIYGIIGFFFYHHDFFWFFTKNPYIDINVDYGHGELLFYFTTFRQTFGWILSVLTILGLIVYLIYLYIAYREKKFLPAFNETLMIAGIPALYFIMHTVFWWKGMMHVLGDTRFMAVIIPFCGLIAIKGLSFLSLKINKPMVVKLVVILIVLFAIICPFKVYQFPIPYNDENKIVKQAIDWMKTTPYISKKILSYNPIVPILLNKDPFNDTTMLAGIMTDANTFMLKPGDIFIWDSHFAASEGGYSEDSITSDINFEPIMFYVPDASITTLGNKKFSVKIFKKITNDKRGERQYINDTLMNCSFEKETYYKEVLEYPAGSKNKVCLLDAKYVYSPTLDTALFRFKGEKLFVLYAKAEVYFPANTVSDVRLVASVESKSGNKYYKSTLPVKSLNDGKVTLELHDQYFLPELTDQRLKVYVYTADNKKVYIDNLVVIRKKILISDGY